MKFICILILFIATPAAATEYTFTIDRVYDGDTIKGSAAIWPGLSQYTSVRINGIDTPESQTKNKCEKAMGLKAKQALIDFIADNQVTISNVKLGKCAGRVLADVSVNGVDVASYMIREGYARFYDGGKRMPWCDD